MHKNVYFNGNYQFRLLISLGMLFVLCTHYGSNVLTFGGIFDYDTFQIPLFIFISGYFYKEKNSSSILELLSYIKKKFYYLVVPYYLWNFFYFIVCYFLSKFTKFIFLPQSISFSRLLLDPLQLAGGYSFNLAAWFLMTLFFCQVVYAVLLYFFKRFRYKYISLFFVFIYFSYFSVEMTNSDWSSVWKISILRVMFLLIFFYLGNIYRIFIEKYDKYLNSLYILGGVIVIKIIIIYFYGNLVPICFSMEFPKSVSPFCFIFSSILGIYFWLKISQIAVSKFDNSIFVNFMGQHTYSLMMHQGFFGFLINGIMINLFLSSSLLDAYHSRIWFNCFSNQCSLFMPILIILSILAFDYVLVLIRLKLKQKNNLTQLLHFKN